MMNNIDIIVPKVTVTPIGPHIGEFAITIGIHPIDAAAEVRKIGLNLRFAACSAASRGE